MNSAALARELVNKTRDTKVHHKTRYELVGQRVLDTGLPIGKTNKKIESKNKREKIQRVEFGG